jgi:hypothetical protein
MHEPELDRRLRRMRDAASAATRPRDPAATEWQGRRRQRIRRLGSGATLLAVMAAAVLFVRALPAEQPPPPVARPLAAPTTTPAGTAQPEPDTADRGEPPASIGRQPAPPPGSGAPPEPGGSEAPPTTGPGSVQAGGGADHAGAQGATLVVYDGLEFVFPGGWVVVADDGCPDAPRPEVLLAPPPPQPGPRPQAPTAGQQPPGPQPQQAPAPSPPPPAAVPSPQPLAAACGQASEPFAVVRWQPAFTLPGGVPRTVNGLRALVRLDVPPEEVGVRVPSGWTVSQAVIERPDGGVLLMVGEPGAHTVRHFESILDSVHPA